jgi:hypothetical protein
MAISASASLLIMMAGALFLERMASKLAKEDKRKASFNRWAGSIRASCRVMSAVALLSVFVAIATKYLQWTELRALSGAALQSSVQNVEDSPDLDLHVWCPDGRHVGMDYATGQYDVQIADAITNGDNLGAPEWILFPPTPENSSCVHSVSARDNRLFLDANPEAAAILGSATDSYSIYARYIDPASGIFTSSLLEDQVIAPDELIVHAISGTTDVAILPGVPDTTPPVTTATASGTLGADGVTYVSDVTVTLSSQDDASGVADLRYSLDGGATYVPYPGQIVLTLEGDRTVTFFSADTAGNAEAPKTLEVKIDRQAPETAIVSGPADPSASDSATSVSPPRTPPPSTIAMTSSPKACA